MNYFPSSYEESRQRFIQSLDLLQQMWPRAELESHPLENHPDLTIDWIWAEPVRKENIIILTAALHGVEGFVGSAMQYQFMMEFMPRLNPENTGLLLVHAINPWGMKHLRRFNSRNVDLNRNFVYDGDYGINLNHLYPQLKDLLVPKRRIDSIFGETLRFSVASIRNIARHGLKGGRDGILMGQYIEPDGFYYGGQEPQEETLVMMGFLGRAMRDYSTVLHLDMHTGYGPRYQMSLTNPDNDPLSSGEFARKYNYPLVVKSNPDEFYTILGDISAYAYHLAGDKYPDKRVLSTAFEFGTFGDSLLAQIRSLRAEVMEMQLSNHGAKNETIAQFVRKEYMELFYPPEARWREKALADGRQAFKGILHAHNLIGV